MQQLLGCIPIDKYITPAMLSPGLEPLCWIFQQDTLIFKIPGWFSFSCGLFVLPLYLWFVCYLLDSLSHLFITLIFCAFIGLNSKFFGRIQVFFKGSICYIFAILFCMSKREHLWSKEKCFLIHFESSFHSLDNKIFNFSYIQMSWQYQMPKNETRNTFYWITWEVNTVW